MFLPVDPTPSAAFADERPRVAVDTVSISSCPPPAFVHSQIQRIQRHLHSEFNETEALLAVFQLFSFFRHRHRGLDTLRVWKTYVLDILEQAQGDHLFQDVVTLLEMKGVTHGVPLQCLVFGLSLQDAEQLPHLWVRTEDHFASRLSLYSPASIRSNWESRDVSDPGPDAGFEQTNVAAAIPRPSPVRNGKLEGLGQKLWQRYVVHELSSPGTVHPYPFRAFLFGCEGTGKRFSGLQFQQKLSRNKEPGTWLFHDAVLSRFDVGLDSSSPEGIVDGGDDGKEKEIQEEKSRLFYTKRIETLYRRLETALEKLPQLEEASLVLSIDASVLRIPRFASLFPLSAQVHLIVTADEEDTGSTSDQRTLNRLAARTLGDRLGVVYRTTQEDLMPQYVQTLFETAILENVTSVVTRHVAKDVAQGVTRWVLSNRSSGASRGASGGSPGGGGGGAKERGSETWTRIRPLIRPVCSRVIANFSEFLERVLADITSQLTMNEEERKDSNAAVTRIEVTTLALREALALDLGLNLSAAVPERRDVLISLLDDFVQQFQRYVDIRTMDRQVRIENVLKTEKVAECLEEAICSMLDGMLKSETLSDG
jgi:hypothetical protein